MTGFVDAVKSNLDIARRKMSAYWFAVGIVEHNHFLGDGSYVDLSEEFARYCERQAEDYYAERTYSLQSVPDQWRAFCRERGYA